MTRSASPYTQHGATVEQAREERRVGIVGDPTPFQVAHRQLGEWRQWREVLDANGGISPFALRGVDHAGSQRLVKDFALVDGSGVAPEDLTRDLGISLGATFPDRFIQGVGAFIVEDVAFGEYTVALRAPGEEGSGAPVTLLDTQWAAGAVPSITLEHAGVEVTLDVPRELWLVLWLAREFPITLAPDPVRDTLIIPGVELG